MNPLLLMMLLLYLPLLLEEQLNKHLDVSWKLRNLLLCVFLIMWNCPPGSGKDVFYCFFFYLNVDIKHQTGERGLIGLRKRSTTQRFLVSLGVFLLHALIAVIPTL